MLQGAEQCRACRGGGVSKRRLRARGFEGIDKLCSLPADGGVGCCVGQYSRAPCGAPAAQRRYCASFGLRGPAWRQAGGGALGRHPPARPPCATHTAQYEGSGSGCCSARRRMWASVRACAAHASSATSARCSLESPAYASLALTASKWCTAGHTGQQRQGWPGLVRWREGEAQARLASCSLLMPAAQLHPPPCALTNVVQGHRPQVAEPRVVRQRQQRRRRDGQACT